MKKIIFLVVFALSIVGNSQNQSKKITSFNLENKLALQGYDPVSYFKQNKATKGKKELAASHNGITYYFSSKENKEVFLKNAATFEPQFGGWCAYAMGANGEKVSINPETFKIIDGKLYLYYNAYFNNTLKSWNKDEVNLKAKANSNWKKLYN